MNWVKEITAWIKIHTRVIAAGSNNSKPAYMPKRLTAQMTPSVNAATCPTMVIALVLILDLIRSFDKPKNLHFAQKNIYTKYFTKVICSNLPHLLILFVLYKWKNIHPYKNIIPLIKISPIKMLAWTMVFPNPATSSSKSLYSWITEVNSCPYP